ncbi:hypothetical protein MJO29_004753 [Puccinia striiformis f. sp. tritici]|uniref:Secreted protein n=1 Tax=Puccinia striiformis TaxID=27350 RepID=A0A2S4W3P3_9BASI|nr:hypothetical protein Pst134EB_008891 [Puccinia striiformis f. sp. tritici]KAI7964326.1 hypothetical protein MJO29_004753 [Puccinia striiformis f. sp. tritici]POW16402.1 hypothetical protein PSHT_06783 [Puccinia striiformis]
MLLYTFLAVFIAFIQIGSNMGRPQPATDAFATDPALNGAGDENLLAQLVSQMETILDTMTTKNDAGDQIGVYAAAKQLNDLIPNIEDAVTAIGNNAINVRPGDKADIDKVVNDVQVNNYAIRANILGLRYGWDSPDLVKSSITFIRDMFISNAKKFDAIRKLGAQDKSVSA